MAKLLTLAALDTPRESAFRCRMIAFSAAVARVFPLRLILIARHLGVSRSGTPSADSPDVLLYEGCLLYTSPSPRDRTRSRMPSSA